MRTLNLLLLTLSLTACASSEGFNRVDWSALSQQYNNSIYGNPQGQIQQQPQQQQRRVDLQCVQDLRARGYSMNLAHAQCSY